MSRSMFSRLALAVCVSALLVPWSTSPCCATVVSTVVVLGDETIPDGIDTTTPAGQTATDSSLSAMHPAAAPTNFVNFAESFDNFLVFDYNPIAASRILAATLSIDITDADGRILTLTADSDGTVLGSTLDSGDNGGGSFGNWRAVNVWADGSLPGTTPNPDPVPGGNLDNIFVLPDTLISDLADGKFIVDGSWTNPSGGVFASNRAVLEIFSIPEPASGWWLILGTCLTVHQTRRRHRSVRC